MLYTPVKEELWAYLGGLCYELACNSICIGGYHDHVHLLCLLSKKTSLMKLVERVKSNSSRWLKTKDQSLENFRWQDGYGAFSVGHAQLELVKTYIATQQEHHQKRSFLEEFMSFLKKYGVVYDERYLWD